MTVYTIDGYCADGTKTGFYSYNKRDAIWQAERLFNRGEHTRVEVTLRTSNGATRRVHIIRRPLTEADWTAIRDSYPKARKG